MINAFSDVKQRLVHAIQLLAENATFNVIAYSDKVEPLSKTPLTVTADAKRKAFRYLDSLTTTGTDDAIPQAFRDAAACSTRSIVWLTDCNFEVGTVAKIDAALGSSRARFRVVLFGYKDDTTASKALERMVRRHDGVVFIDQETAGRDY